MPIIIGIAMRKWFGERVFKKLPAHPTQLSAEEFLESLKESAKLAMEVKTSKRTRLTDSELVLARELAGEKGIQPLAEAGLLFGLALLGRSQPELLKWREWALKFSWAFPAFSILVVIFAAVVGSFVRWALPAVSLAIGGGTLVSFLAAWVEWQAAGLTGKFLKKRAIIAREDDRIAISQAMRALAARRCVPGMLQLLFPESKGRPAE
ncbi:hypothetical protein [Roseibacillus persicicus]|uniref:hypothetical protein n=1 Tax=Roseibacillus persicicus TaxID=454148 RepID=UPI00280E94BA|nr:hypothetical protein [Roseibacillus persicicus]MDQ8192413.1 hypothetical protein [Roseibacillus persicicus]